MHKTLVIEIVSLKTTNLCFFSFYYYSGDRTWQPLLVSSQPILDFLEPCAGSAEPEGDSVKLVVWHPQVLQGPPVPQID